MPGVNKKSYYRSQAAYTSNLHYCNAIADTKAAINQINQITVVSISPGTVRFGSLPQNGESESPKSDRSFRVIVSGIKQECLDTTSECLNGCCGTRE